MAVKTKLKIASGRLLILPLIDLFFLLLIFFLISSSLVFQPGIPVKLPESEASTIRASEKIVVTLTKNDLIFFNDRQTDWDDLERNLRQDIAESRKVSAAKTPRGSDTDDSDYSPMLVLRADREVPYNQVMRVMSLARSLNLGVYLVTDN